MPSWMIVATTDDPQVLAVVADSIVAVDAGDAVNQALASGMVPLTDTSGGRFRVLPLDGAREYRLDLQIVELGSNA